MATTSADVGRTWDLIETLKTCFFVTRSGAGGLHSRPLSSIPRRDAGVIHFLVNADNGSTGDEVANDPKVLLAFGNGSSKFVTISGRAEVSSDHALISDLWNAGAQAFWPDGPMTPGMRAVTVRPDLGEFWDGPSGLVASVKMAFAVATGRVPDLGDNEKVSL